MLHSAQSTCARRMTYSKRSNVRRGHLSFRVTVFGSLRQTVKYSVGDSCEHCANHITRGHEIAQGTWQRDCANSLSLLENRVQNVRDSRHNALTSPMMPVGIAIRDEGVIAILPTRIFHDALLRACRLNSTKWIQRSVPAYLHSELVITSLVFSSSCQFH